MLNQMIEFPKISDPRGNLTFIEGSKHIPFDIKRVYYLYDVPGGESRGGHAHKNLKQLLIALSGSFEVHLNNGTESSVVTLNRPNKGLLIPNLTWRELHNFSSGSVCLVLASEFFSEGDYIRNFDDFKNEVLRCKSRS